MIASKRAADRAGCRSDRRIAGRSANGSLRTACGIAGVRAKRTGLRLRCAAARGNGCSGRKSGAESRQLLRGRASAWGQKHRLARRGWKHSRAASTDGRWSTAGRPCPLRSQKSHVHLRRQRRVRTVRRSSWRDTFHKMLRMLRMHNVLPNGVHARRCRGYRRGRASGYRVHIAIQVRGLPKTAWLPTRIHTAWGRTADGQCRADLPRPQTAVRTE